MSQLTLLRAGLACVATVVSLLLPGSAPAATPTWLTPGQVLSDPTHEAADVHVAVAPGGHTMAVWREQVGATYVVKMSEHRPGGPWTVPWPLWSGPQQPFALHAVVDDAGHAAVAFSTSLNGKVRVRATMRSSLTDDWSTPQGMGADPEDTRDPDVALGTDGRAILVFRTVNATGQQLVVVTSADGSDWDGYALTGLVTFVGASQVAVDSTGVPTVAWHQAVGSETVVYSRSRLADGSWAASLAHGVGNSNLADLVTSGRGDVVLLWRSFNGSTYRLFVRSRTSGASWGPAMQATAPTDFPSSPRLAVDAAGHGTIAYGAWDGNEYEVRAISQTAAGAWPAPVTLSTQGQPTLSPSVVVDGAGVATVAWVTSQGAASTLQARSRATGDLWQKIDTLGPAHPSIAANGSVGADRDGNVVVAWEGPGIHTVGRLVALDAAGPRLALPALPPRAYAGKPVAMSISAPTDVWSEVGQVSWSFGDGGSAAGLTAEHTWPKRGSYPVVVTATDAIGNATSTSTNVAVIGRPRLSKPKLTRARLHPGAQDHTRLLFRLDTDARLVARVRLLSSGRRVVLTLVRPHLAAGRRALLLRSTMNGVHLPVGTYSVALVATNPAGRSRRRTVALRVAAR